MQQKALLQNQAVKAALDQDWNKAVEINQEILSVSPDDIPTLNRLGFALTRIGEIEIAKETYTKVLNLDKLNPIAKKNLQRLAGIKKSSKMAKTSAKPLVRTSFIEEPGKTKTISLVRPAAADVLLQITTGMEVNLVPKKRRVCVETAEGEYLGCIPDDVGLRLEKLLKVGYGYQTNIKAAEEKNVSVFIKETKRSARAQNVPSFPGKNAIVLQTDIVINKSLNSIPVDTTPTGEESDSD